MGLHGYGTVRVAVTAALLLAACVAWGLDPHQPLRQYGRQSWGTEKGLPQSTVRAVTQTRDGFLWLGTEDGLARFDGVEFRVYTPETTPELASSHVEGLTVEGDRLRVRTLGGESVLEGGRFRRDGSRRQVEGEHAHGAGEVTARLTGRDGRLWVGTTAGLMRPGSHDLAVAGMGAVRVLFEDREGAVWAGCDEGLARVVGGQAEVLQGSAVLAVFEDREGSLWVGTEADGVMELREQRFTSFGQEEGLRGSVARAVWEDKRGTMWVGTDGGGLSRLTASGRFEEVKGLSSDVVLALAGSADGELWVGTPTGLNQVRGGRVARVYTAADGLADDYVRSLLVDRRGDVWVGTRHGLTRMPQGGTAGMTTFTAMDGLGSDFIGVMVEARDGSLWIGTSGGLTRRSLAGTFTNFTVKDGLASDVVTAILEDADGGLWLGSDGSGLSRRVGDRIERVEAKGLPPAVFGILEDGRRRMWISSRSGIFRLEDAAGARRVTAYDTADGMRVREASSGGHPAAVRARDGRLWFATLRGVTVVDPENLRENAVPPLVAVERVLVNDVEVGPTLRTSGGNGARGLLARGAELVVAPGPQRVEFQYAGLSFVAPQKVMYRYRLEGLDTEWVAAGTHRAAFYTNLRPGRYVFHVAAANNDGVWSEGDATVLLRVRPFPWQTWWFYGLMLLCAAGLAYAVYARRVRRVEARYAVVMEERGRIAREIHDGLAQGIVSISLQLEVVGRLLGTSVEAARVQLEEAKSLVRQSLAEARSSIWELREEGAGELPVRLGKALKEAAGERLRLTVTGSYRALAREVEDELLRIAQEAVTNAARHSGCSEVGVTLMYDLKGVRLEVRDDGRGFDVAAGEPAGHFGLVGMRERAAKIGARLQVRSEVGRGTEVAVEVGL